MATEHTQHIQKSLSQMNLQIDHVLSDIMGASGLSILDAILAGNRDSSVHGATRSQWSMNEQYTRCVGSSLLMSNDSSPH